VSAVSFLGSQAAESGVLTSGRHSVTPGTSNAKGSYDQLIAATAYPAAWVLVTLSRTVGSNFLVDIAVGAGGSEQVVVPNLPYSTNTSTSPTLSVFLLPLHIPAGSRIAARAQHAAGVADTIDVQVTLFAPMAGGEKGLERVEACGALTASSLGTSVDPGTSANTKGAWSELVAATAHPYRWACLSITHDGTVGTSASSLVDVGIGAAGSEVVVVPNLAFFAANTIDAIPAPTSWFPFHVPAGTRIAVRSSCNQTGNPDRLLEAVLHGVG
jgi:hypothetical protein